MAQDGTEYEKFNLNEERELGRFDPATGVFVWNREKKDDDEVCNLFSLLSFRFLHS